MELTDLVSEMPEGTTWNDIADLFKTKFIRVFESEQAATENGQVLDYCIGDQIVFGQNVKMKKEIQLPLLTDAEKKTVLAVDTDSMVVGILKTI